MISDPHHVERRPLVIQDRASNLPLSKGMSLARKDDILFLAPEPLPPNARDLFALTPDPMWPDPFEPLGRALARHYNSIRHVPYHPRFGLDQSIMAHMNGTQKVVFIIWGPNAPGEPSPVDMAESLGRLRKGEPRLVVTCCPIENLGPDAKDRLPTIIEMAGCGPQMSQAAALLAFQRYNRPLAIGPGPSTSTPSTSASSPQPPPPSTTSQPLKMQNLIVSPQKWQVEDWDPRRDLDAVHRLWSQCLPKRFELTRLMLRQLLERDGYARHYVVREPRSGDVLGFCATYTCYLDGGYDRLVGSLAALLVGTAYRERGIGLSLHDYALQRFRRTKGMCVLQLGSIFPRLMYGIPVELASAERWFRRRECWKIDGEEDMASVVGAPRGGPAAERKREVCDWTMRLADWADVTPEEASKLAPGGLVLRPCLPGDYAKVKEMLDTEFQRQGRFGEHDRFSELHQAKTLDPIIVGKDADGAVVAVALTYACGYAAGHNGAAANIPWPTLLGPDYGGITGICIADSAITNDETKKNVVLRCLMDACVRTLRKRGGIANVFVDAYRGDYSAMEHMGFHRWASYREFLRFSK